MAFSGTQALSATAPFGSLTLNTGGGISSTDNATISLGATGGAGLLALGVSGNTISNALISPAGPLFIHTVGNLTLSGGAAIVGAHGHKADAGTLFLTGPQYYSAATTINGGTFQLASGAVNTLFFNNGLMLNSGGTLDLNGGVQYVGTLSSQAQPPGGRGRRNHPFSSAAASTLILNSGAANFSGTIGGSNLINLVRSGSAANLTLLNPINLNGGALLINGGTNTGTSANGTILADNAVLTNVASISLNYATLSIDNSRLVGNANRVPDGAPITINGGALNLYGRSETLSTETVGAVTLNQGTAVISSAEHINGVGIDPVSADLTLSGLGRTSGSGATVDFSVNFNGNSNTINLGLIGTARRILVTGGMTKTNNIIGGYAVATNVFSTTLAEFASYNATEGVAPLNTAGYAGYDGTALVASQPQQNIRLAGTALTVTAGGSAVNSLNLANSTTTAVALTFNAATDVLNLTSGGLLVQNVIASAAATTIGVAGASTGVITAGGLAPSGTQDLYLYYYGTGSTLTVNSQIADNTNGGDAPVRFVAWGGDWGAGNIILANPNNNYTGGTVVNNETLTIAALGKLPGNGLTINGSTVTQTATGIITSQAVTLNGGSTLTLNSAGTNRLTSLTFNNNGGTATPTVSIATGILSLAGGGNSITVNSANVGTTAAISGGTLDFGNGTPTITVNPIMVSGTATAAGTYTGGTNVAPWQASLNISSLIQNSGLITIAGGATAGAPGGVIQLSSTTSTFTGGITLSGDAGLVIGASSTGTVTSGPLGTGTLTVGSGSTLLSSNAANSVSNAVVFSGGAVFNGVTNLTLAGTVSLPGVEVATVTAPQMTATLSGVVSGAGTSFTKQGLGILALANAANTITGPVTISQGTLGIAADGSLGSTNTLTINGGYLGTAATASSIAATRGITVGASGGGFNPASGQTLTINSPITGSAPLAQIGAGTTVLAGNNSTFSGGFIASAGALTITSASGTGTGVLTVSSGGTLNANVAGAVSTANLLQTGGTVTESVANAFASGVTLNLSGGVTTLNQANSYTGGANISGTNVTTVSAAGALSGTTTVTGGTLISSITTAPGNNGSINLSGGVLTSAAAGGQFQNVNLLSGGLINPGGVGTIGTAPLTILNLATSSGGTLQFDILGTSSLDQINSTGTLSVGSGTKLDFSVLGNPTQNGNYKLIQYAGTAPTLGNFVLPTAPTGETYSLSTATDSGFIDLVVSGTYSAVSANWLPTAGSTFSWNTPANWSGGAIPRLAGDTANFNTALAGFQSVTVDGQQHVGTLILNPTTSFTYTINTGNAGSLIHLDNAGATASLQNLAQNNTINAAIVLVSPNTNVNIASGTTLTVGGVISGANKLTEVTGTGTLSLTGTNTFTGGLESDAGTVAFTATANLGAASNPITLNGGNLSQTGAAATPTLLNPITVGASGGTFTIAATTQYTGKILLGAPNQLQGSGTLTKAGPGDLQILTTSFSPNYSGNWIIAAGTIEAQAPLSLGTGSVTINGSSSATALTNGELDIANVSGYLSNAIILNGATGSGGLAGILAPEAGTVTFGGSLLVNAPTGGGTNVATINLRDDFSTANGRNLAIGGALSGAGNLTLQGPTAGLGILTFGGSTAGYTGSTITVGAFAALGLPSGGMGAVPANTTIFINANATLGLVADGDGTSTPQTIAYTQGLNPITFNAGNLGYLVGKIGATALSNQEANKTISLSTNLANNLAGILQVTPQNGYGLLLTGQTNLTAAQTYNVGGTQASNVVPGLTLQNLSANAGLTITKTGTGTLRLQDTTGTGTTTGFGGAATIVDITGGFVSFASDNDLGKAANTIKIDSTTGGLMLLGGLGTVTVNRPIQINTTPGFIAVGGGSNLSLTQGLVFNASNALSKSENGTLTPTAAATGTVTGATNINAGAIAITNSNQIGSGTITVANSVGAALQISGGGPFTQALTLNSYGIQGNGALEVTSGSPTWNTGVITVAAAGAIGVDSGASTLTIGSSITLTSNLGLVGPGSMIVNTAMTGAGSVTQYSGGTVTFNATGTTYGALTANIGTIVLAGTATIGADAENANMAAH